MKNHFTRASVLALSVISSVAYAQASEPAAPGSVPAASAAAAAARDAAASARDAAAAPDAAATPAPRNPLRDSAAWRALLAASGELAPVFEIDSIPTRIEKLKEFAFSDATQKLLEPYFKTGQPLHLQVKPARAGSAEVAFVWDGIDFRHAESGEEVHSAALTGRTLYSKAYTQESANAVLPWIKATDSKGVQVELRNLSYSLQRTLRNSGLWMGVGIAKLQQITIDDAESDLEIDVSHIENRSEIKEQGKSLSLLSDTRIKSIDWGSDALGPIHFEFRVNNIDSKDFAAYTARAKELNRAPHSMEERQAAAMEMLKQLGLSALDKGMSIDIVDVSGQYHGSKAGMNGRIDFGPAQPGVATDEQALKERFRARLNVFVPMSLVKQVSRSFARKMLEGKDGVEVTDRTVDSTATAIVDNVLAKPLKEKWIRIEGNTIRSTIEFKQGKLYVGGKEIPIPKLPGKPAPEDKKE